MFLRHLEKSVRRKAYPLAVRYIKRSWESEGVCYELPSVPKAEARGDQGVKPPENLRVLCLEKISMNAIFRIFSTC